MTPAELAIAVEAENERQKDLWYMGAYFVSHLLAPHLKKGRSIKPEMLIPKVFRHGKGEMTKKDAKKELKDIKKRLGIE